jgi:hypothetical protein
MTQVKTLPSHSTATINTLFEEDYSWLIFSA